MLIVKLKTDRIFVGQHTSISFQRTEKVLDGTSPGVSWGVLPVQELPQHVRNELRIATPQDLFLIPVAEEEAVWLGFQSAETMPSAIKIGVGGNDAITGGEWNAKLSAEPQNYIVCPPQLSFETVCRKHDGQRQITGGASTLDRSDWMANSISLAVYQSRQRYHVEQSERESNIVYCEPDANEAGGALPDRNLHIHRDPYGLDNWDTTRSGSFNVYMVDHQLYRRITKRDAPPAPSSDDVYQRNTLP